MNLKELKILRESLDKEIQELEKKEADIAKIPKVGDVLLGGFEIVSIVPFATSHIKTKSLNHFETHSIRTLSDAHNLLLSWGEMIAFQMQAADPLRKEILPVPKWIKEEVTK